MSQELLLEQRLLTREFVEGNVDPNGEYVSVEELRKRNNGKLWIEPIISGDLKKFGDYLKRGFQIDNSHIISTIEYTCHLSNCSIIFHRDYTVKYMEGTLESIGFLTLPATALVITEYENQQGLEQCSEFLRGLGYVEVRQEGSNKNDK